MGENFRQRLDSKDPKRRVKALFHLRPTYSLFYSQGPWGGKKCGPSLGNRRPSKQKGAGPGPKIRRRKGFLLIPFFGKKAQRIFPHHHKFKTSKQVHSEGKIQNGVDKLGHKSSLSGLFHGEHRPKGCLLSRTHSPTFPAIPAGCHRVGVRGPSLPIPGPPLRDHRGSSNLYQNYSGGIGPLKGKRRVTNSLSGRLPFGGKVKASCEETVRTDSDGPSKSRMENKLGEIQPGTISDPKILGDDPRFHNGEMLPSGRKSSGHSELCKGYPEKPRGVSQAGHGTVRSVYCHPSCSRVGSNSLSSPAARNSGGVGQLRRRLRESIFPFRRLSGIPQVVGATKESYHGKAMEEEKAGSIDHRCQSHRLGSPRRRPVFSGSLGVRRGQLFKLQGIAGGNMCAPRCHARGTRKTLAGHVRQHDNSDIRKQAGGHKKQIPDVPSVRSIFRGRKIPPLDICCAHKGDGKYAGRFSQPPFPTSLRVGPKQRCVQGNNKDLGHSRRRLVCDQSQQTGAELLLPRSDGEPMGSGRPVGGLAMGPGLRLSPHTPSSKGTSKDKGGRGQSHHGSSLLAKKIMVQPPVVHVSHRALGVTRQGGPSGSGSVSPPSGKGPASDGMGLERQLLKRKGFSEKVIKTLQKSRKPVTYNIYYKAWRAFERFRVLEGAPARDDIRMVLDFLQRGVEKGLKTATLRVQVTALSTFLGKSLAANPWIIRFLKATSRMIPARSVRPPPWDLSLVLNALTKSPFEPLEDIPIKLLTLKTVFLVAITSARRVGELSALVSNPPYTRILDDRVVLRTDPAFLPKVVSPFHRNQEVVLPSFCTSPSSAGERAFHTLDVRRALIEYLSRCEEWRKCRSLFVLFGGTQKGSRASKSSIARWIKQAIQLAYEVSGVRAPSDLRAHSTRALSTSWAEFHNASVDQICGAATWSSQNTFFRHYRLDLADTSSLAFGRKVLQTVVPP